MLFLCDWCTDLISSDSRAKDSIWFHLWFRVVKATCHGHHGLWLCKISGFLNRGLALALACDRRRSHRLGYGSLWPTSLWNVVTEQRISNWITDAFFLSFCYESAITLSDEARAIALSLGFRAHSTRSMASYKALAEGYITSWCMCYGRFVLSAHIYQVL